MQFKKDERGNLKLIFCHVLTMPVIYGLIVPLLFFDVMLEIYHRVGFRLYNLKCIKRGHYIRVDRHKLKYLNLLEKFNCMYCGYANGLLSYGMAIASLTESYWCGIMHQRGKEFNVPDHHKDFLPYGDEEAFREFLNK